MSLVKYWSLYHLLNTKLWDPWIDRELLRDMLNALERFLSLEEDMLITDMCYSSFTLCLLIVSWFLYLGSLLSFLSLSLLEATGGLFCTYNVFCFLIFSLRFPFSLYSKGSLKRFMTSRYNIVRTTFPTHRLPFVFCSVTPSVNVFHLLIPHLLIHKLVLGRSILSINVEY